MKTTASKTISSKPILTALLLAGLAQVDTAHAVLATGDRLTINSGTFGTGGYINGGSYFGMNIQDPDPNITIISAFEKAAINYSTGDVTIPGCTSGPVSVAGSIPIGSTSVVPISHGSCIDGTETPAFDIWEYFGATGMDFIQTTPVTDNGNGTLNWSGWRVTWNGIPAIDMGGAWFVQRGLSSAWQPGNCAALGCTGWTFTDGVARFQWDGVYGNAYTLDYTATVPRDGQTNFSGVQYYLHLEGTVQPIPIPAAVWLFGSGLLGLVGLARRKKKA